MTTPAMPELLREIVAYCREAGHDWSSLAEADHMLATLSSQPSPELAGVSDEEIDRICYLATEIRFAKTDDAAQAVIDKIRAILALRPQVEPVGEAGAPLNLNCKSVQKRLMAQWGYEVQPAREPMTIEQIRAMLTEAGYDDDIDEARGDFINGIRYAEAHHGITAQGAKEGV